MLFKEYYKKRTGSRIKEAGLFTGCLQWWSDYSVFVETDLNKASAIEKNKRESKEQLEKGNFSVRNLAEVSVDE